METRISPQQNMKTKPIAYVFLGLGALLAVAAVAGPPVLPNLNPPPAPDYTCKATGDGAICRVSRVSPAEGDPSGFVCGTAENPVELLLYGTDSFRITRYYNRAGNLTRRFQNEDFQAKIVNPITGISATITQNTTFMDTLATPGDFSSVTTQFTGVEKIVLPGSGVLLLDAGRFILDADDNIVSHNGRHDYETYFGGDTSVAAQLCEALGTSGTP